jgi:hypothetical protein
MMAKHRLQRLQELVTHLGRFHQKQFYTKDTLIRQLQTMVADADLVICSEALHRAQELGIIHAAGSNIMIRRAVTPHDLQTLATMAGSQIVHNDIPPETEDLARLITALPAMEQRLARLQSQVDTLGEGTAPGLHHWLELHPAYMPRAIREGLRAEAVNALGLKGPSEEEIVRMMVLLAAKALSHLYRKKP